MKTTITVSFFMLLMAPASVFAVMPGVAAPAFTLADVHGNTVTLDSLKGKVVLLNFWAPWCRSCKEELPDLDGLQKKYSSRGFTVLSICIERSGSAVSGHLQKRPVSFPVLVDKDGKVSEAYFFSGLPASFIIGKDGIIRYRHTGSGKELLKIYEQEINGLLNK
ncbi:MAG TPA: TlpA disulfide reductase family protein [Nitrospirota bacterium]|nr:TlpA disulfide reductase family protein [Nitrospirota bacterium]